tara:strand:- start:716 stop:2311 length:1596 start_codon:yes stop_codon:yes gene_type:complete
MNDISDRLEDLYDTLYDNEINKIESELYDRYTSADEETKEVIIDSVVKKRLLKMRDDIKISKDILEKIGKFNRLFSLNYRNLNFSLKQEIENIKFPKIRPGEIYNELPIIQYISTNSKRMSESKGEEEYSNKSITEENFLNYNNILIPLLIDGYTKGNLNLGMFIGEDEYARFLKSNRQEMKLPFQNESKKGKQGKGKKKKKKFRGGRRDKKIFKGRDSGDGSRNKSKNKSKNSSRKPNKQNKPNKSLFNVYKNVYLPGGFTIYKELNEKFNKSSKETEIIYEDGSAEYEAKINKDTADLTNPIIDTVVKITKFQLKIDNDPDKTFTYPIELFKNINNVGSKLNEVLNRTSFNGNCDNINERQIYIENMPVNLGDPYVDIVKEKPSNPNSKCVIKVKPDYRKQLNQLIYFKKLSSQLNYDFLLGISVREDNFLKLRKYFFSFLTSSMKERIKYLEKISDKYTNLFGIEMDNLNNNKNNNRNDKRKIIELIEGMVSNIEFKLYKEKNKMSDKEIKYWMKAKKDLEKDLKNLS